MTPKRIRITHGNQNMWYHRIVGSEWDVIGQSALSYQVHGKLWVMKADCEVIDPPQERTCKTCRCSTEGCPSRDMQCKRAGYSLWQPKQDKACATCDNHGMCSNTMAEQCGEDYTKWEPKQESEPKADCYAPGGNWKPVNDRTCGTCRSEGNECQSKRTATQPTCLYWVPKAPCLCDTCESTYKRRFEPFDVVIRITSHTDGWSMARRLEDNKIVLTRPAAKGVLCQLKDHGIDI